MNILTKAAVFIILIGLSLGLPGIDSFFIDFSELSEEALALIQLGLLALGASFFLD